MFDMNALFEEHVGRLVRRALAGTGRTVALQGGGLFCLTDVGTERGLFQTRPDILIREGGRVVHIIDTKWKRIAADVGDPKRGISQADVYQRMAYGRLYGTPHLTLLFPHHAGLAEDCGLPVVHRIGTDAALLRAATVDAADGKGILFVGRYYSAGDPVSLLGLASGGARPHMRKEPRRSRPMSTKPRSPRREAAASPLAQAEPLAATLPPLLVEAERVAATVAPGLHGRRRAGVGETFWQYRRYEAGDMPRSIDWRRSARADPVFVRELEWEAAQTVWLAADGSGSMDYASARHLPTKADRAALLALALAVVLDRGGERFALLDTDPARALSPGGGRLALRRLAAALERPSTDGSAPPPALSAARHGQAVLIGDLLAPLDETAALVGALAGRGVRGCLVQVLDPAEEAFPFRGRLRVEGLEAEGEVLLDRAEHLRAAYVERLREHRAGLEALARSADWRLLVHHTDQSAAPVLMGLYQALAGARGPGPVRS